jgi:hypothetical protein
MYLRGSRMELGPIRPRSRKSRLVIERVERLAYLADMLSELQDLAAREGCVILAGLISLSQAEAERQVSGARRQT